MDKIEQAQKILEEIGLPHAQCNEMSALTLLALCDIKPDSNWKEARKVKLGVSKGIMQFVKNHYGKDYAPNTRETFRRFVLHQFVQAGLVDYNPEKPDLPVNSPNAHYAINDLALKLVKSFGSNNWNSVLKSYLSNIGELKKKYIKERKLIQIPVKLSDGTEIELSAGKHNLLQADIIEKFASRFAKGGVIVYLGDTAKKNLYIDKNILEKLKIPIDKHSKLPDIVIYCGEKNWLYLIEAVTSHGPVSPKRIIELEKLLEKCASGKIYITAFPTFVEFKKYTSDIAWETEVWVSEFPDHLIHFNGDKFIGPR